MSSIPHSPPPPGPLNTAPYADQPPPGAPSSPQSLSQEEQSVVRACQSESFWYRSLPLSALLSSFAHFGVQRGYLKPHPSWGARPKIIVGSIVGYFLGKFSYVDVCAEKFLIEAPDSNIAEAIRARRGLPTRRQVEQPQSDQEPALFQPVQQPSPIYQNQASPTYGQQGLYQEQQQQVGAGGYDDLRRRNREAAQASAAPPSGAGGAAYYPLTPPSPPTPPAVPEYPVSRARVIQPQGTNKYGDEGFE